MLIVVFADVSGCVQTSLTPVPVHSTWSTSLAKAFTAALRSLIRLAPVSDAGTWPAAFSRIDPEMSSTSEISTFWMFSVAAEATGADRTGTSSMCMKIVGMLMRVEAEISRPTSSTAAKPLLGRRHVDVFRVVTRLIEVVGDHVLGVERLGEVRRRQHRAVERVLHVHPPRLEPHQVHGHAADEDHEHEEEQREQDDRPVLVAPEPGEDEPRPRRAAAHRARFLECRPDNAHVRAAPANGCRGKPLKSRWS